MADTTIVIAQRGHVELTRQCVESLRAEERAAWPVVVVDDGSPGGAADWPCADDAPLRLCRQPQRGVSAAWNRGARVAGTPFIVFLNNDTITRGPWVDRLVQPLRDGACAMSGVGWRSERALPGEWRDDMPCRAFLVGWCFAMAASTFARLGGFDEALRVYWSDTDLQLRAICDGGGDRRRVLREVTGLPLRHLGHRTAHDRRCLPQQRGQWLADRRAFEGKWRKRLALPASGR